MNRRKLSAALMSAIALMTIASADAQTTITIIIITRAAFWPPETTTCAESSGRVSINSRVETSA